MAITLSQIPWLKFYIYCIAVMYHTITVLYIDHESKLMVFANTPISNDEHQLLAFIYDRRIMSLGLSTISNMCMDNQPLLCMWRLNNQLGAFLNRGSPILYVNINIIFHILFVCSQFLISIIDFDISPDNPHIAINPETYIFNSVNSDD